MAVKAHRVSNAFDYLEKEYQLFRAEGSAVINNRVKGIERWHDSYKALVFIDEKTNSPLMVVAYDSSHVRGVSVNTKLVEKFYEKYKEATETKQGTNVDTSRA